MDWDYLGSGRKPPSMVDIIEEETRRRWMDGERSAASWKFD